MVGYQVLTGSRTSVQEKLETWQQRPEMLMPAIASMVTVEAVATIQGVWSFLNHQGLCQDQVIMSHLEYWQVGGVDNNKGLNQNRTPATV